MNNDYPIGEYTFGKKIDTVLLMGPPGAGKGTFGKMLSLLPKFYHFSSGDMFRRISEVDIELSQLLKTSKYVSDEDAMKMFYKVLEDDIAKGDFDPQRQYLLLDGMPRTVPQVKALEHDFEIKKVVELYALDTVCIERMLSRNDGREQNNTYSKAMQRIEVYRELTEPAVAEYRYNHPNSKKKDWFVSIDNSDSYEGEELDWHCKNTLDRIIKDL